MGNPRQDEGQPEPAMIGMLRRGEATGQGEAVAEPTLTDLAKRG
jgi:hypothetical protein